MNNFKKVFYKIQNIGINDYTQIRNASKIKLVNVISAICLIVMLITSIVVFFIGINMKDFSWEQIFGLIRAHDFVNTIKEGSHLIFAMLDFICAFFCLIILYLNHRRKFKDAIFLFCTFAVFIVSIYFILGGEKVTMFFLIPIMIPIVFYDKKSFYLSFVGFNLLLMYVISSIKYSRGDLFIPYGPEGNLLFLYFLNFTVTSLIVFIITVHFKRENTNNQKHLIQKNTLLQSQSNEIISQRDEIIKQKQEIEIKNTNITDSIHYAKNIQTALLPRHEILDQILPNHFILLRPKDIVSGDFYWFTYIENLSVIAAVDCTGHGVPGAFMSMLGSAFLNEIVNKEYITHPGVILRRLRKEVIRSLHQIGESGEPKDGMDLAICVIDYENMKLQFAGANNPLYLVRKKDAVSPGQFKYVESNGQILYEIRGDRMPVSLHYSMNNFTVHEIDFIRGDMIYLFSDGYADQFGGPLGKKLSYKYFRNILLSNSVEDLDVQKERLEARFDDWKGDNNQIDDIMVVGIRL